MNKQPNTLVFDIGGVLIDWNPRHLYRMLFDNEVEMEKFLQNVCSPAWNLKQDAGRSFAEATAELIQQHPEHAELIEAYDTRWEETISGAIEPTVKVLEGLRENGHELYGLSNWSKEKFAIVKDRFTFLSYFEDIVVSGEVGLIKPDPKIFKLFLKRSCRNAEDCLFIDDSQVNIAAAETLGFYTILFKDAVGLEKRLNEYGFRT
jgi:2-haloacid dehalogenase